MEMVMTNGFTDLTVVESVNTEGGSFGDYFEKIEVVPVAGWIYQAGEDFGAASVKFGRECYDFYRDVKTIFS